MRRDTVRFRRLLAEGAVIVISVLVALAAQAWWERHTALDATHDNLMGLARDFAQMDTAVSVSLETADAATGAGKVLLRALHGSTPEVVADSALGLVARLLFIEPAPTPSRAAYDELLSTGRIELIGDAELRRDLSDFYGSTDELGTAVDMFVAATLQTVESSDFAVEIGFDHLLLAYANPQLGTTPDRVARWSRSSRILNDLAFDFGAAFDLQQALQLAHERIGTIRSRLDAALQEKGGAS